jgi:hypothetical protein
MPSSIDNIERKSHNTNHSRKKEKTAKVIVVIFGPNNNINHQRSKWIGQPARRW